MRILYERGLDELATVYAAAYRNSGSHILEFVDSLSGSRDILDKWVIVLSSQFGCPVGCPMCDTKGYFKGNPTVDELLSQVDHLVNRRFPDGQIPSKKFKVQFARMGEPALNLNVPRAAELIGERYDAPGYMPCISTTAPMGSDLFFNSIKELNHDRFRGRFQLQFSVHSTDRRQRDRLIPISKWDLERISGYGEDFYVGGRKVALNFAMAPGNQLDVKKISELFSPEVFMVKLTPVNPTQQARLNQLVREDLVEEEMEQIHDLRELGFQVVVSVGDLRENSIGSNCGQLAGLWKKDSEEEAAYIF
ncbi:MAG: radical SAM protein [Thermoplasmatota archaeon]